jgi:hypothetical protein
MKMEILVNNPDDDVLATTTFQEIGSDGRALMMQHFGDGSVSLRILDRGDCLASFAVAPDQVSICSGLMSALRKLPKPPQKGE